MKTSSSQRQCFLSDQRIFWRVLVVCVVVTFFYSPQAMADSAEQIRLDEMQAMDVLPGVESSFELSWPMEGIRGPVFAKWRWDHSADFPAHRPAMKLVSGVDGSVSYATLRLEPLDGYYSVVASTHSKEPLEQPIVGLLVLSTELPVEESQVGGEIGTHHREVHVPIKLNPKALPESPSIPWWVYLISFVAAFFVQEAGLQVTRQNVLRVPTVMAKFTPLRMSGGGVKMQRGRHGVGADLEDAVRKALNRHARFRVRFGLFFQQPLRTLFGEPYADVLRVALPLRGGVSAYLVEDARVHRALASEMSVAESLRGDEAIFVVAKGRESADVFSVARSRDSFMGWQMRRGSLARPGVLQRLTKRVIEIRRDPDDSVHGDDWVGWRIEPRAIGQRSRR